VHDLIGVVTQVTFRDLLTATRPRFPIINVPKRDRYVSPSLHSFYSNWSRGISLPTDVTARSKERGYFPSGVLHVEALTIIPEDLDPHPVPQAYRFHFAASHIENMASRVGAFGTML
jgi:hypothetical protein